MQEPPQDEAGQPPSPYRANNPRVAPRQQEGESGPSWAGVRRPKQEWKRWGCWKRRQGKQPAARAGPEPGESRSRFSLAPTTCNNTSVPLAKHSSMFFWFSPSTSSASTYPLLLLFSTALVQTSCARLIQEPLEKH